MGVRTGRCLCGHVRYELEGELPPLVNCHCQFCRRAHGAAFVTIAWVPRQHLRIVSGERDIQRFGGEEGYRYFCAQCGVHYVFSCELCCKRQNGSKRSAELTVDGFARTSS